MSDVQLLETLCSTQDDQFLYAEFVKRFLVELQTFCDSVCQRRKLDPHIGRQIVHESFERVRKYKSYKKDGSTITDDQKAILSYLKRIATRLFNNHYSNQKKKDIVHKSYLDDIQLAVNDAVDARSLKNKKDLAKEIYGKLNKKEKAVIIKDLEYKKHQKYLPDDVTASLATDLQVQTGTIRKIRERAIEKIKKAIDEINRN